MVGESTLQDYINFLTVATLKTSKSTVTDSEPNSEIT